MFGSKTGYTLDAMAEVAAASEVVENIKEQGHSHILIIIKGIFNRK
jgi:hypothetical protein